MGEGIRIGGGGKSSGAYVWEKYSLNNRLPSGYKELEYIQGTGTQYFNTGVAPNANTVIYIDFGGLVLPSSTDYALLGSAWGNYSLLYNSTSQIKWYASGGGNVTKNISSKNSVKITSSAITINGTATSIACSSSYPSTNIWVFNTGDNGAGTNYLGRFKLYALKIYNGSTLVRDYVPAMNSNGEVGLYDLVNNTFGKSSGSGEFAAGEEIIKGDFVDYVVSDNPTAYPDGALHTDGYYYEKIDIVDMNRVSVHNETTTLSQYQYSFTIPLEFTPTHCMFVSKSTCVIDGNETATFPTNLFDLSTDQSGRLYTKENTAVYLTYTLSAVQNGLKITLVARSSSYYLSLLTIKNLFIFKFLDGEVV